MKGKISIGRYTSNQRSDMISIGITDEISGTPFLEVEITPEILGLALTGLGHLDCAFTLHNIERVGKQREQKTETLSIAPVLIGKAHALLLTASLPYCVDGWLPMLNEQTRYEPFAKKAGEWCYQVSFVRWVDVEEGV